MREPREVVTILVSLVFVFGLTGCQTNTPAPASTPTLPASSSQDSGNGAQTSPATTQAPVIESTPSTLTGTADLISCHISPASTGNQLPYCMIDFTVTNSGNEALNLGTFVFLVADGKSYQGTRELMMGDSGPVVDKFQEVLNPGVPVSHRTFFNIPNGVHLSQIFFSWTSSISDSVASFDVNYDVNL